MSQYPQQSPQWGNQPNGHHQSWGQPGPSKPAPMFGALLALVASVASVIGTLLPWYDDCWTVGDETDCSTYNGWKQMSVVMDNDSMLGSLMGLSFGVVILGMVLVVVGVIMYLSNRQSQPKGGLGVVGSIVGLVGGMGLVIGYLMLGATDFIGLGTWIYGLAWIVAFIGALGMNSRKF